MKDDRTPITGRLPTPTDSEIVCDRGMFFSVWARPPGKRVWQVARMRDVKEGDEWLPIVPPGGGAPSPVDTEISDLKKTLSGTETLCRVQWDKLVRAWNTLRERRAQLTRAEQKIDQLQKEAAELKEKEKGGTEAAHLHGELLRAETALKKAEEDIDSMTGTIAEDKSHIDKLEFLLNEDKGKIERLGAQIQWRVEQASRLFKDLAAQNKEIDRLKIELTEALLHIDTLSTESAESPMGLLRDIATRISAMEDWMFK